MTTNGTISDEQLLPELVEDSAEAFTLLYERHHQNIYRLIFRYVHSAAMADDLMQEVFIKVWNNRKQLGAVRSFKGYILIIARNHTLNSLKTALRIKSTMGEVVKNFVVQRKASDEQLLERDYAAFLQRELEKLPDRTRTIFCLCRQEYYSYEEVARQLGISKSAVKNHMVLSMKVLKKAVENELGVSLATVLAAVLLR